MKWVSGCVTIIPFLFLFLILSYDHPNILELWGSFSEDERYCLVCPFMSNGSLFHRLHNEVNQLLNKVNNSVYVAVSILCDWRMCHCGHIPDEARWTLLDKKQPFFKTIMSICIQCTDVMLEWSTILICNFSTLSKNCSLSLGGSFSWETT